MSQYSGGSAGPSFRAAAGRRRGTELRSSLVVYRENPMCYEPDVLCNCNPWRKAPRWISWSAQNPGRRYYSCVDAMNGRGCGFVEWYDNPPPKFWSDLLGDLRDEVWRLRGQQNEPRSEEEIGQSAQVMALQEKLKKKDVEMSALKCKYETLVFVVVVFVIGLVVGKLFF